MNPADGFVEFVRIVDAGSVAEAARQLEMPRPTLARRLAKLEASLGVRLLHRRTRSMSLTEAGRLLLPHARSVTEAALIARAAVAQLDDVPRGRLRLSVPPNLELSEFFSAFLVKWPEVGLDVLATSRLVDLATEGFHAALRFGDVGDETLIGRKLGVANTLCVASPALLARVERPTHPDAFIHLPCLVHLTPDGRRRRQWPLRAGGTVRVHPAVAANDIRMLKTLAEAGRGFAMLPEPLVAPGIEAGTLEPLLNDMLGLEVALHLVYVERAFLEPKVRVFLDHVREFGADRFLLGAV